MLQGAELRKARREGQIAAEVKCHGVWFQARVSNDPAALNSHIFLYPVCFLTYLHVDLKST